MAITLRSRRWFAVQVFTLALAGNVLLSGGHQSIHGQTLDRIERERAEQMLNTIKSDLKKLYYDPTFHGVDIDARFKLAEDKLKQATSLGQAFGIIAQALIDLNDSHTVFIPPPRPGSVEYGWQWQIVGDKCFVAAVKPGSDAEKQGLKPGDHVISVEGFKPVRKEMWKVQYYYYTLSPRRGLNVVVQSPGGQPRQLDLAAKVRQKKQVVGIGDIMDMIREEENEDRLYRHRLQELGDTIVWKMPSFSFEPEQSDDLMGRVRKHKNLILDLRGNGGGYVVTLERLVGFFFDKDLKIADRKGRKEMKPMLAKTQGGDVFGGKVIVLIDSRSASASEIFARLMQLEKRGIVIGDVSAGAVMQSIVEDHDIGGDRRVIYAASITNADVIMSDGASIEHVGVRPDEFLLPTAEDLAAARDVVLARALKLLGIEVSAEKAGALFPIEWRKN